VINYTEIIAVRGRDANRKGVAFLNVIWEYQMAKKFGLEFYNLDERTAQAFSLINSITNIYEDVKSKEKK